MQHVFIYAEPESFADRYHPTIVDTPRVLAILASMPSRTKQQLLDRASELRAMASAGDDLGLRQSLLQVAEEFELEAARLNDEDQSDRPVG